MITAEITRRFIWYPRVLHTTNAHYTTSTTFIKWLSFAYVEKRIAETGYTEYWTNEEQYLKHFNIATGESKRYWRNDSKDWVYSTDQWMTKATNNYFFIQSNPNISIGY